MNFLIPGPAPAVTPATAGWRYVSFEALRLGPGQWLRRETGGQEVCAVLLAGRCAVTLGGEHWPEIGGRDSVFDGPPTAIYAPPNSSYELEAGGQGVELAIGSAPATTGAQPRILTQPRLELRGRGNMARRIHHILMEDQPAESLLVTEVVTPGGNWSSYPPHKHDTENYPCETYLEETYFYRLRNPNGFAVQRVYSADRSLDETITATDGDLILVPGGYHAVSAAPGYEVYYLNVMAGPIREWKVTYDPAHAWLR